MSETLEQIALRVAQDTDDAVGSYPGTKWLYEYSRRLVAALGAQEPVAVTIGEPISDPCEDDQYWLDNIHSRIPFADGTKLYAAPQLPQRERWQWVPVEATDAMLNHCERQWNELTAHTFGDLYKAMLAAAPKPEDGK